MMICSPEIVADCLQCRADTLSTFNCSLPGLESLQPGIHEGVTANYLSFVTNTSSPNFPARAKEFERCTGGRIQFSEAANVWEDPVYDLGTARTRGSELFDGYFMSYSHFPEVSALGLAEHLNDRIRQGASELVWPDVLPKVRTLGEYRTDGMTNLDFLMFDGDFFVPIVRIDLLEQFNLPLPNSWDEVVEYAQFFNGTDLNDDGNPNDFGFCHFPRVGAGNWDWWAAEAMYATWATMDQTQGINQGFFFDEDTMGPRIGEGFKEAMKIWKELWTHGEDGCNSNFAEGRCAIGFAPPGCWKGLFLDPDGVARKDANGNVIWRPTMKSGEYAEPYRFKPFGSLNVVDRASGELTPCTPKLCPKAERVPLRGHHGRNDRASVLPVSPIAGKLMNRAPYFWSGGLGTLIRKSSARPKKDLLWDFFVYCNSPTTSVHDVANYASWLDAWRASQLRPGDNYLAAGWSATAYQEHASVMEWALSNDANGVFNLRLPGLVKYTRDVMGGQMSQYIAGEVSIDEVAEEVRRGWQELTAQRGKLNQLAVYRASLGREPHSEFDLCRLHRVDMDERDPSLCRKYDPASTKVYLPVLLCFSILVIVGGVVFIYVDRKRRASDAVWRIVPEELRMEDPPRVLGNGSFGAVFQAEYRGTKVAVKRAYPTQAEASEFSDLTPNLAARAKEPSRLSSTGSHNVTAGSTYTPKLKAGFWSEMKHLSKLRHPCIISLMGAVEKKGETPMLVLELMAHGSLHDVIHNETFPLEAETIFSFLRDISSGMRFLHAHDPKIIHGDLKSSNILVDDRFRAKVADFGLSQSKPLIATGSLYFMAPELLRGESVSTTMTDSYSFGVLLFEVFSRQNPYDGEEPDLVLEQVTDKRVNRRPGIPPGCPEKVRSMMKDCLEGEPHLRPSFEEIGLQLGRLDVKSLDIGVASSRRSKTDNTTALLREMFPVHIAAALRAGKKVKPESHDAVTIFFSDIVGFTNISSNLEPLKVSDMLDRLYTKFDSIADKYQVFKVETIGDSWMGCCNLSGTQTNDHTRRIAKFAMEAVVAANETLIDTHDPSLGHINIRVGFHCGPVVTDVVGSRNPRYCLFGDSVNTASRTESSSEKNRILCTESAARLLRKQDNRISVRERGLVPMKGKGEVPTFWVGEEQDYDDTSVTIKDASKPSNKADSVDEHAIQVSIHAPEDEAEAEWLV